MIYIISENNDVSTDKVINWLNFYQESYNRVNVDSDYLNYTLNITNDNIDSTFSKFPLWIRRGHFPLIRDEIKKSPFYNYLKNEYLKVNFFSEKHLSKTIGSFFKESHNNKLENLFFAKKNGLNIPDTIVTNNRNELINFIDKNKKYITKSIFQSPTINVDNNLFLGNGTTLLDENNIPENFSLSLIQEYIDKKFEIRTFFVNDDFFSMAIFSQNDNETKIDYRNYNNSKPNRCVPFELPIDVIEKLKKFNLETEHNTGSIDLIYTTNDEYVFLEINPMGQFDWVSGNCNYNIEKKIAEILINFNKDV